MQLRNGYNYSDYFIETYEITEPEGDAVISVEVDGIKTEFGDGVGYGVFINLKDGKIVSFSIKAHDIELTIPATIEMHNKISTLLAKGV